MIDHTNCDHPKTRKDRAACRKAKGAGKVHTAALGAAKDINRKAKVLNGPKSFAEANEPGNIDHDTLDDRIREAKRRPKASPVVVRRAEDFLDIDREEG